MELYIVIVNRKGDVLAKYVDEALCDEWHGPLSRTIYEDPSKLKGLMAMGYSSKSYLDAMNNAKDMIVGLYEMAAEAKARLEGIK